MIEIKKDFSLKSRNTFGLEVNTRFFVEVSTIDKISFSLNYASYYNLPNLVLGGGSNILFTKDFNGIVIQPTIQGIEIAEDTPESTTVKVGAGVNWDSLVEWAVSRGLGGLENLSLIPGNVGASPIQNIGAYGVEAKDTIVKVEGLNVFTKKIESYSNAQCQFDYRSSIFKHDLKHKVIITHVFFKLPKKPLLITHYGNVEEEIGGATEKTIRTVREAIIAIRKRKLPAGWLIEQCGWKGKQVGNCGAHKDQALVIVNYGNATGNEILNLAKQIQKSVNDQFGISIEMEVNVV